jgi:hypothetical protein
MKSITDGVKNLFNPKKNTLTGESLLDLLRQATNKNLESPDITMNELVRQRQKLLIDGARCSLSHSRALITIRCAKGSTRRSIGGARRRG